MSELPLEIGVEESHALLEAGEKVRLIDCREEDEWQICRIEGAELAPLSRFGEEARARFTDPEERIVIYCHHGMRSLRATNWLRERGFAKVQSMRGGIDGWADLVAPEMTKY